MQKSCCASAWGGNQSGPAGSQGAPCGTAASPPPCAHRVNQARGMASHRTQMVRKTLANPIWLLGQLISLSNPSWSAHPWQGKTFPTLLTSQSIKGSLTNHATASVSCNKIPNPVSQITTGRRRKPTAAVSLSYSL